MTKINTRHGCEYIIAILLRNAEPSAFAEKMRRREIEINTAAEIKVYIGDKLDHLALVIRKNGDFAFWGSAPDKEQEGGKMIPGYALATFRTPADIPAGQVMIFTLITRLDPDIEKLHGPSLLLVDEKPMDWWRI